MHRCNFHTGAEVPQGKRRKYPGQCSDLARARSLYRSLDWAALRNKLAATAAVHSLLYSYRPRRHPAGRSRRHHVHAVTVGYVTRQSFCKLRRFDEKMATVTFFVLFL